MRFFSIASGSSGNAYALCCGGMNFLVDAGISGKRVQYALEERGIRDLAGIFITHEHRDHIAGAGIAARRYGCPIFATHQVWRFFMRHDLVGRVGDDQVAFLTAGETQSLGPLDVMAFPISHDAVAPVGFCFEYGGRRVALATDLGCVTQGVQDAIADADLIVLEANHDPEMLQKCRYPADLKRRVASQRGHLSNGQCGALLAQVCEGRRVLLAHLSEESNTPMLAMDTVRRVLDANEIAPRSLEIADRHMAGQVYEL
jgi:phosphoribosyl 1,2-cyclic phosphodiesterase